MGKRISFQEKKDILLKDIINKMFEISNNDITFDDIKDRKDNWYEQYTMTSEQNEKWKIWSVKEIRKRLKYNKIYAETQMEMIDLMWGLKINNNFFFN